LPQPPQLALPYASNASKPHVENSRAVLNQQDAESTIEAQSK
jgi:hypothetical protein